MLEKDKENALKRKKLGKVLTPGILIGEAGRSFATLVMAME